MSSRPRKIYKPRNVPCLFPDCTKLCNSVHGLNIHLSVMHPGFAPTSAAARARLPPIMPFQPPAPDQHFDFEREFEFYARPGNSPQPEDGNFRVQHHPHLTGRPCDAEGNYLPHGAPPPPRERPPPDDFFPYDNRAEFELADLLYRKEQMSGTNIDELLQIWAASLPPDQDPPFADHDDLYGTIDSTELGDAPWQSFTLSYDGDIEVVEEGEEPVPLEHWKTQEYEVWFRDPRTVLHQQLGNPDFKDEMDFAPKRVFSAKDGKREYCDFMSGNWSWRQADIIINGDALTRDATFCPIILGSDKTTVSVATGQNDYYPLYMSNGLVRNNVRRAHRNALTLIGFLAIPKTDREHKDSAEFRTFRRQLFHRSLREILATLKDGMKTPEIVLFGDGHHRRVIYRLGPYIGDYPEQVLLACVVQGWCARCTAPGKDLDGEGGRRTHELTDALLEAMERKELWDGYGIVSDVTPFTYYFERADIHELLSSDLLHQIIKGTFKDHLVTWVGQYLTIVHGKAGAERILADIDRRIAAVPPFPGLRRFKEGRGFKQWTGDDSKALMKVYLPAIAGHVPPQMVRALSAFLEFCYLVRRNIIDEDTLTDINDALAKFHKERTIFMDEGVRPDGFSLPRQHSMVHYTTLIQEFGAPNGLCSSITESKHIKAVKEPWRRSSRFEALGQMLTINQRLDKLAASRVDFVDRGMLDGSLSGDPVALLALQDDEDDDGGAVEDGHVYPEVTLARKHIPNHPQYIEELSAVLELPLLPDLVRRFLYQRENPDHNYRQLPLDAIPLAQCPEYEGKVKIYPSATATFYAPSDQSGINGMFRERIRAVKSWRGDAARYDCIFVEHDADAPGFRGLFAARVKLFFKLHHRGLEYPCALVTWFSAIGDEPCPETGLWRVEPDLDEDGEREMAVIHLDSVIRAAHLIGIYGEEMLPDNFLHSDSLDNFEAYYINKYADHQSHEIAF